MKLICSVLLLLAVSSCSYFKDYFLAAKVPENSTSTSIPDASNADDQEQPESINANITDSTANTMLRQEIGVRPSIICADKRISSAREYQDISKKYLQDYYRNRNISSLYYSWYALEDSNHTISTVVKCQDKSNKHFYTVANIKKQNQKLEKYIAMNRRKGSYNELQQIYLNDYKKLFPRDLK